MNGRLRACILICLIALLSPPVIAQVIVPPEGLEEVVILNADLSYPDNYEEAMKLFRASRKKGYPEKMRYLGTQALLWAKKATDQNRIQAALMELSNFYTSRGQYQMTDSLLNEALALANLDTTKARIYLRKVGIKVRTQDWTNADTYLVKARHLIGNDTLSPIMATYYFTLGLHRFEANHDMVGALLDYQKAKRLPAPNRNFTTVINHNIAGIYTQIEDYAKAEEIAYEILDSTKVEHAPKNELFAYYLLGFTSLEQQKYEQVKDICYQAIALRERTGITVAFGYAYFLLGESHLAQQQLDSAEYYFQLGIDLSNKQGDGKELVDCTGGIMKVRLAQERYEEAAYYGEQVLSMSRRPDQPIHSDLASAYHALGHDRQAYLMLKENMARLEEEDNSGTNVAIISALLEEQFRQERASEALAHKQQLTNQRLVLIVSALGLFLFVLSLAFYLQNKSRRKLKQLNTSLSESNAALQQFAYITSHDLKEPVRNITSFSSLLDRRLQQRENTQEEQDFLEFITSNAAVLREIVDALQIFTKISFGQLERESVDLPEVFRTVQNNLQQTLEEKNGQLAFFNSAQVEHILFSRPMLILVLQNLIQNGFKYNEANEPVVKVTVQPQGQRTLFLVEDNGVGIESEYFERIFSPFKTLKNKSVTQSSGLGLSICKNILERYEGSIWVTSDGKTGSTFSFVV